MESCRRNRCLECRRRVGIARTRRPVRCGWCGRCVPSWAPSTGRCSGWPVSSGMASNRCGPGCVRPTSMTGTPRECRPPKRSGSRALNRRTENLSAQPAAHAHRHPTHRRRTRRSRGRTQRSHRPARSPRRCLYPSWPDTARDRNACHRNPAADRADPTREMPMNLTILIPQNVLSHRCLQPHDRRLAGRITHAHQHGPRRHRDGPVISRKDVGRVAMSLRCRLSIHLHSIR